jgi:hypothetical protein
VAGKGATVELQGGRSSEAGKDSSRWAKIRAGVVSWGEHGSGTPKGILLAYVVKGILFAAIAVVITGLTTPGLGGIGRFGQWWAQPVFFQKTVVWALLFEIIGLGCGAGPLSQRTNPLIGGVLYWLRPRTLRLPPWPNLVPATAGTSRTWWDVVCYAGVLASALFALGMPGATVPGGMSLQPWVFIPLAVLLLVIGLRDKTVFLAARAEHYWVLVLVMLFPLPDQLAGAQLVTVLVWWGAAFSKLNRHFPSVVAVMLSNSPVHLPKPLRRKLYRDFPRDMRPSAVAALAAHLGTFVEFAAPLVLLVTHGTATLVAVIIMVLFHLNIIAMFPMGVPLEWNLMMIFSAVVLFGGHGDLGPADVHSPLLAILVVLSALVVIVGNLWPSKVSFLFSMRYYAGNWPTSLWCFRGDSADRVEERIVKPSPSVRRQLTAIYGADGIKPALAKQVVFRAMHLQGRALNGLLPRALDDLDEYEIIDGEIFVGPLMGWNLGDGHMHNEQLLDAVQQRCGFAPGELRVVFLESQPIHRQRQHYRIVDARTGLLEQGYVTISDMAARQPWLSEENSDSDAEIPVRIIPPAEPAAR